MAVLTNMYIIECPRCGGLSCEVAKDELLCPNCLYHETSSAALVSRAHSSAISSENMDQESENFVLETLGENIEQVPSDFSEWDTRLENERNLE